MTRRGRLVPLTTALAFITAAAGATQAAAVHAGDCGEYKYWHNGIAWTPG